MQDQKPEFLQEIMIPQHEKQANTEATTPKPAPKPLEDENYFKLL